MLWLVLGLLLLTFGSLGMLGVYIWISALNPCEEPEESRESYYCRRCGDQDYDMGDGQCRECYWPLELFS
jgi:hypothetical protein